MSLNCKNKEKNNEEKHVYDLIKPSLDKLSSITNSIIAISLKNEKNLVDLLLKSNIKSIEFKYKPSSLSNVQKQIQELIEKDFDLYSKARSAYKSYVNKYVNEEISIYKNLEEVDHVNLCFVFGLSTPIQFSVSK